MSTITGKMARRSTTRTGARARLSRSHTDGRWTPMRGTVSCCSSRRMVFASSHTIDQLPSRRHQVAAGTGRSFAKSGAGSSAGSASFCCILVHPLAEDENPTARRLNTLPVPAFSCTIVARILSPARLPVSPLRHL